MKAVVIIPARMAASRFAGKPMAELMGMPMIGHCYHRSKLAAGISSVHVATCDNEIADYVKGIGGSAIMTSDQHTRATTRTAEALEIIQQETNKLFDVVVMVQGDEPLIAPDIITATLEPFKESNVKIVNIMSRLQSIDTFKDMNNVKVVVDRNGDALYFSRESIPSPWKGLDGVPCYNQTGIIAFRTDTLEEFNAMNESPLEIIESVDMNRVLEAGESIRMVLADAETFGVDTPAELKQAERILRNDPICKLYINL